MAHFFFIYSTAGVTHDRQIYFFIFCCCCHVTMIRCHYRPSSTIWKRITNKKNAWIYLPDRREEKKKTVQLFTFGYDFPRGGLWSSMATAYVPKYRYEPSKLARRKIECFFFFFIITTAFVCVAFFFICELAIRHITLFPYRSSHLFIFVTNIHTNALTLQRCSFHCIICRGFYWFAASLYMLPIHLCSSLRTKYRYSFFFGMVSKRLISKMQPFGGTLSGVAVQHAQWKTLVYCAFYN